MEPDWIPTRAAGAAALERFLPHAGRDYARRRNYDLGPGRHDNVSRLSPWLRHRLLAESEVVAATLAHHGLPAAEKFIQETCWRTYWKGWLERRPDAWRGYRAAVEEALEPVDRGGRAAAAYEAAVDGRSGIECFDHWVRELADTGYLHNHARMWFASIWIFTLELPWALGADFFLRHLLDGDPASNTLSWRWVAGLQTRGKTYLARAGNIARYTEGRFRPEGQLAPRAEPVAEAVRPPLLDPPAGDTPDPRARTGLLVTEDDALPEGLLQTPGGWPLAVALQATDRRSPLPVSDRVTGFAAGALDDALDRNPAAISLRVDASEAGINRLLDTARTAGVGQLVTPWVPVGPTREVVDRLEPRLRAEGIALVRVLREWDRRAWPHATAGFFAFWKRLRPELPELIEADSRAALPGELREGRTPG